MAFKRTKPGMSVKGPLSAILPGAVDDEATYQVHPEKHSVPPVEVPPPNPVVEERPALTLELVKGDVPVELLVRALEVISRRVSSPLIWQAISEHIGKVLSGRRTFADVKPHIEKLLGLR